MKVLIVSEGLHEFGGALEQLVRHLARKVLDCAHDRVNSPVIHIHPGKGGRLFKRAVGWMREAAKRGCEALILVIDEDGHADRRGQIDEAQTAATVSLPRALGIAIRSFDAWMLADEGALSAALQYTISRQGDPEKIRNPKKACTDMLAKSKERLRQREMYERVAAELDCDVLKTRCPAGFAPFAERVAAL